MKTIQLLGLRIDCVTMSETLDLVERWVPQRAPHHIVTADASMVVIASTDPDLRSIIDSADVVTPDGAGILWASRLLGTPLQEKVSGVDLVQQVCRLSAEKGWRVYFLGAAPGVAQEAADNLRRRYPSAAIVGAQHGYFKPEEEDGVVDAIRQSGADVLFVGFGIPRQEKWIRKYADRLGVSVAAGIGGSFDVYSGRVRRAPMWMQKSGLEWLYRLCANPKKISKVKTLPVFAFMALRQKLAGRGMLLFILAAVALAIVGTVAAAARSDR